MTNPTISDFKQYFFRDFPYGDTQDLVTDPDITNALQDAQISINSGLFEDNLSYNICFLLLSAHFLVTNLRASSQGVSGQYSFLQGSRGVGSVSESFQIPQRILDHPYLSMLCKTNYGAKYVMMLLPRVVGQMFVVSGGTQA